MLHLLHHLRAAGGGSPFAEGLHHNHHVGIFHGHRVGGHFGRTDFGYHMLDFGEAAFQPFLRFEREFDALAQRTACREGHLHGKVTFVEGRDELGSQLREEQQREQQGHERDGDGAPYVSQAEAEHTAVDSAQPVEKAVGQGRLHRHGPFQEEGSHHGDVGDGQEEGTDDAEYQCLGHRREIFSFDAGQRQDGEEHDEDDEHGERGTPYYPSGSFLHFVVHFLAVQGAAAQLPSIEMGQDAFQDDDGAVHHDTEVDGAEAHQVGRHVEDAHQDEGEEHGQRDDRSHNQAGTHVAQEDNQYQEHDDGSFHQVTDDGGDVPVHQFRAVQVGLYRHAFGQHLLYLGHPFLQFFGHHIGVGALEHHGDAAHTLAFAVLGHGSEAFGRAELYPADVADVYRYAATVGHHNLLHVVQVVDHTFRADVIGAVYLFDVAAARILVVAAQGLEHLADGDVQRVKGVGVYSYLILFQVSAEAVDFHNAGDARKLSFHNPVLDGAQLHGVVAVLVARSHLEYILVDLAQTGRDGHQFGRTQFGRNFAGHHLDLFVHQLTGVQRWNVFLEDHRHERQPEA